VEKLIGWLLRPANIGLRVMHGGLTLFAVSTAGNWLASFRASDTPWGKVSFEISNPASTPELITAIGALLGLALAAGGAVFAAVCQMRANRQADRKRVVVLEMRGLVDTSDAPLKDAIPGRLIGQPESVLIDLRQCMQPPVSLASLEGALEELNAIPRDIRSRCKDFARSDISTVVAGILQVPFLFHVGMLLDDEGQLTLMDWERTAREWRELGDPDDGILFQVSGLAQLSQARCPDIVVAVSASYLVNELGIAETFSGMPIVHLRIPEPVPNALWSEAKQQALANQFLQVMGRIVGASPDVVHLVLAAPSSLSVRLGSCYDARNFPAVVVYQYEQSQPNKYPWGVRMKTHGVLRAEIVETSRASAPA